MKLDLSPVISILGRKLCGYEVKSGYDLNRRWVEGLAQPDFTFCGILQPASDKILKHLPEGDVQAGVKTLHTHEKLEVTNTSESQGQELKQVFIRDNGEIWRVANEQNWDNHSNFYRYTCVKFLDSEAHTGR